MVNFYSGYVSTDPNNPLVAHISDVVKHINHIRKVAGVDHVGIGGDYNGVPVLPEGLEDVSKYPNLFAALISDRMNPWSKEDLAKLSSGNIIRVLGEIETVRDKLANEELEQSWIPLEDLKNHTQCYSGIRAGENKKEMMINSSL